MDDDIVCIDLSSRVAQPNTCIFCQSRCSQRERRRITPKIAEYITTETGRTPVENDALCNKCRTLIQKFNNEAIYSEDQREVEKLSFANPGKFMENFNPQKSKREMRKAKRKTYAESGARKNQIYDERGRLVRNEEDLCDCLDRECPGCFFPCPKCSSPKCGTACRNNRRWYPLHIEVEGHGIKRRFPFSMD